MYVSGHRVVAVGRFIESRVIESGAGAILNIIAGLNLKQFILSHFLARLAGSLLFLPHLCIFTIYFLIIYTWRLYVYKTKTTITGFWGFGVLGVW